MGNIIEKESIQEILDGCVENIDTENENTKRDDSNKQKPNGEPFSINFYQGQTDLLEFVRKKYLADQQDKNNQTKDDQKEHMNDVELYEELLNEIKLKIAELFNIKNIHFLFGSGTSSGAIPMMSGLYNKVVEKLKAEKEKETIDSGEEGLYSKLFEEFQAIHSRIRKEDKKNLEEILGILYSNRIYLENHLGKKEELEVCTGLIKLIEEVVFNEINVNFNDSKCQETLRNYQVFYQKLALRNRDLSRLNIFTTNNDLFNETAMDSQNVHYINGFGGGLHRYFNPALFNYTFSKRMDTSIDKYEPADNVVNLFKIHGSVNWAEDTTERNLFFKIKEVGYPVIDKDETIMIYPTPTKQNKSLGSPYVELFREFQRRLLLPHSVLFIIGYSFSDEHVNNVIYQALATNSSLNVVIVNNLEGKPIWDLDDNRLFRLWGESGGDKIHYFKYFVDNILPNVDHNKSQDEFMDKFISFYNRELRKKNMQ